jgi:pimeloyl-ACP methyl ester carboxylesterase
MPTVSVNGCNLYYESHGKGEPLLFVHGETHGIEMFETSIEHFSKRYHCVAYYRRGHGKSELPPYGYSLWNNYVDLQELIDLLGLQRPVIVAVAMSTPLAATYALHHPQRVRALVLASWYEIEGYPLLEKRRKTKGVSMGAIRMKMEEILNTKGRKGLEDWMEENWETRFPIFSPNPVARQKALCMFASHAPGHYVKSAEYYTSLPNLLPQMHAIKCPILGICGTDDPSPDDPKLLAHLSNYRQAWIEGARRFTMIEKPDAFNAELEKFLGTLPAPDGGISRQ